MDPVRRQRFCAGCLARSRVVVDCPYHADERRKRPDLKPEKFSTDRIAQSFAAKSDFSFAKTWKQR